MCMQTLTLTLTLKALLSTNVTGAHYLRPPCTHPRLAGRCVRRPCVQPAADARLLRGARRSDGENGTDE